MSNIIYRGKIFTIEAAILANGSIPALDFIKNLTKRDRAKVEALFQRLADRGEIKDETKFKNLERGLWEFKSHQIRILCYFAKGRWVILTHGLYKKQDKLKKSELEKALQIRNEYEKIRAKGP